MINVKNVSSKPIGIPYEGGCTTLLPDATAQIEDSYKPQMETLESIGLVEIIKAKAETPAEDTEAKKPTRRKKTEE